MRRNAKYKSALIVICLMSCAEAVSAQASTITTPAVVKAVAPVYPMMRDSSGLMDKSGDVFVETQVDHSGAVVSARAVNGYPLLQLSSIDAARRWRFAPAAAGGVAELRTVRLRFTYQTMSKETPYAELITVFDTPYHVEIRRRSVETPPAFQQTTRRKRRR